MNKEQYIAPEMEIIAFDAEDIITTSLINGGTDIPDGGDYSDMFK